MKINKALLKSDKMKRIEFAIVINGSGRTAEEAWNDAVESFTMEPGYYEDDEIHSVEEEEGYDDEEEEGYDDD